MAGWNTDDASRSYTAGCYAFEMDNINHGWLVSAEGGGMTAEVITHKMSSEAWARKQIGPVKAEDLTVTFGTGMSKAFLDWVKASIDHKHVRKNGAIKTGNHFKKNVSTLEFFDALPIEFGLPALDGSGKDACKATLKCSVEHTRTIKGDGSDLAQPTKAAVQKKWLPCNFRITSGGGGPDLAEALPYVNKIEALTVKLKTVDSPVGDKRIYTKVPASVECPNLVFTVAESHAESLYKWHEQFVVKGNCGQDQEKNFTIEYLDPQFKTLFTVDLKHCGIFKLTPDKVESKADGLRRLKFEGYVEEFHFKYEGGAVM